MKNVIRRASKSMKIGSFFCFQSEDGFLKNSTKKKQFFFFYEKFVRLELQRQIQDAYLHWKGEDSSI